MDQSPLDSMDAKPPDRKTCLQKLMSIFQDICPDYLEELAEKWNYCANDIAEELFDQADEGFTYPRRKKKRDAEGKRIEPRDEMQEVRDIRTKYDNDSREAPTGEKAQRMYQLLQKEFPHHSSEVVSGAMSDNGHSIFLTYMTLRETTPTEQSEADGHGRIHGSPVPEPYEQVPADVEESMQTELQESRHYYEFQAHLKLGQRMKEAEYQHAKDHGLMRECECCFVEFPLSRMVSCEGEPNHLFCMKCPRKLAEELIGQSRYQLQCLSLDDCSAAFSLSERAKFLDEGLVRALELIEQDAVLRSANIEGLVKCPFCPFAAICGPTEENREFPCQNPDCLVVSCRLCRAETHVPISCQEAAQKAGVSARHEIEEAMSAALIRTCNKCDTPFIKSVGCNKVSCTRCGNIQCDVCSENCDYTHFKENRPKTEVGVKACPLYDDAEHRYTREVDAAAKQTRERLANEHPEIDAQYLEIPKAPVSNKRGRAGILRMFEQNAVRVGPRNVQRNAPPNAPQDGAQDGAQDGNEDDLQDGVQDDSEDGSQDGSQDGYGDDYEDDYEDGYEDGHEYDSDVDSQQDEAQDEAQDESQDEQERPNKRQRIVVNEAVEIENLEMPRTPRPHLAVPNLYPVQPANGLAQQQQPQFNFRIGNANELGLWPREQQQQQQQQQPNVQQQLTLQQQQHQAILQQTQADNARHMAAIHQQNILMDQAMEQQQQQPVNFQLMRAHHHAEIQAQHLQRMRAQEQVQRGQPGTVQYQQHALMQARRQEHLRLLMRAQNQFHQQGQQRIQQQAMQMAQQEAQQQVQGQGQAQGQTLAQIHEQAALQQLQQLQQEPSPWVALEEALFRSRDEALSHLSQMGIPPLGTPLSTMGIPTFGAHAATVRMPPLGANLGTLEIAPHYRPLNPLGAQQQALPRHQPQVEAQQQGRYEIREGHGLMAAIAEEGDWRQHRHHGQ